MEMDLVAHCGDSAVGPIIYTLTAVSVMVFGEASIIRYLVSD